MQYMKATSAVPQRVMFYAVMVLLVSACATSGGTRLTIDTRDVPAIEYVPKEVTAMLKDLGYEAVAESDAERWARNFEDYKVQFKARDDANIKVDVDFKLINQLTGIHLYNTTEKTPGAATMQRYNALKKRVEWEFGVDSVK